MPTPAPGVGAGGDSIALMTYWVLKAILTPLLRFFYRVRVRGIDTLTEDQ